MLVAVLKPKKSSVQVDSKSNWLSEMQRQITLILPANRLA